jgi:ABC-2 type transport system permease protein
MWRIVFRHEWRLAARQGGVWLSVATVVVLLVAAGATTTHWMALQRHAQAVARDDETSRMQFWTERIRLEEQELLAQKKPLTPTAYGPRHATNIGHYSGKRYALLPLPPLGALAVGDTDVERSFVLVSVESSQYAGLTDFHQPLWVRAGRFDAAFVVTMILPLLLIAATSPLLAGDRDGVLPLLVSQGAPLGRVAAVRTFVRGGPVLGAAIATVGAIGWLAQRSDAGVESEVALRLVLVVTMTMAYGVLWLALAAWLDARLNRPGQATLALVATWLVMAVIAPAVLHATAVTWYPVPSRADLEEAVKEAQQETWSQPREEVLAAFFDEHRDIDPASVGSLEQFMIFQMRVVLEGEARVQDLEARYARDRTAQAGFLRVARFLSPTLMLQHAFEEAVGAGAGRRARFTAQLSEYVAAWRAYFIPKIYYRVPIRNLDDTPRFQFVEEGASEIVRAVAPDVALLVLASGVCLAMARRSYRRPKIL